MSTLSHRGMWISGFKSEKWNASNLLTRDRITGRAVPYGLSPLFIFVPGFFSCFPPSCCFSPLFSWFLPHCHISVFRCVLHLSIPVLLKKQSTEPHDGTFWIKVCAAAQSRGGSSCQQSSSLGSSLLDVTALGCAGSAGAAWPHPAPVVPTVKLEVMAISSLVCSPSE